MAWHDADAHCAAVGSRWWRWTVVKLITRAGAETLVAPEVYVLRPDRHRPVLGGGGVQAALAEPGRDDRGGVHGRVRGRLGGAAGGSEAGGADPGGRILGGRRWPPRTGIPFSASVLLEPHRPLRLRGGGRMSGARDDAAAGAGGAPSGWPMARAVSAKHGSRGGPCLGCGRGARCGPRGGPGGTAAAEDHDAGQCPVGAEARPPTAAMRFREGARLYRIEAVHESDATGRTTDLFSAVEEVGR